MTSRLIGYDPEKSSGVFTFGGTGTTLYGVKLGLEKTCAGTMQKGTPEEIAVFVSDAGHYCASNIVGWLGIGTNNLITIPTTVENEIDLPQLEQQARTALGDGKKIAAIIATLGTTDSFGLDDLESIATYYATRWSMSFSLTTSRTFTRTQLSGGHGRCSRSTISRRTASGFVHAPSAR